MKLDTRDPLVIDDAARLAKSTFVSLYTKLGYDEQEVGIAWHNIRVTPTGRKIMLHYGVGQPSKSYDIDKEVKRRKEDMKSRHIKPVNAPKQYSAEDELSTSPVLNDLVESIASNFNDDPNIEGSKAFNEANEKALLGGSKEERAKNLIACGITKAKELAQRGKFSLPYAYQMLKKYAK